MQPIVKPLSCLDQAKVTNSSSTKWFFQSLQNGEAQPLHYQEFSLQNGFGANEPLKNGRPYKMVGARGISQTPKINTVKSWVIYRGPELTHSVGEMGWGIVQVQYT